MYSLRENMTNENLTPYSTLTDEELLMRAYTRREALSPLELELSLRLEHALDALREKPLESPEDALS